MKAGDVFENPVTGEYGYIRKGTEETNGKLLIADLRVRVGGAVVGEHYHPTITERFTVISGEIAYTLNGKRGVIKPGETLDLPSNIPHNWWNEGTEEARVIVQVMPAARFEQIILTMFGLAAEGKTDKKGMPNLLQLAVTSAEFKDVMRLTSPPVWLQNILFAMLAPIGRMFGYKPFYQRHQSQTITTIVEPIPDHIKIEEL